MRLKNGMQGRLLLVGLLVGAVSCSGPVASTKEASTAASSGFRTDLTIQDIMDTIVDPSADSLWGSVSTQVDSRGIVEKAPKTDAEWQVIRRDAVLLMESANLLKIPGRNVARPGTKSTSPGIEEEPEGTKKLIDADPVSWDKAADGLYEASVILLKAVEAKDAATILDAGNKLDEACEGCHLKYWYPNQTEILRQDAASRK